SYREARPPGATRAAPPPVKEAAPLFVGFRGPAPWGGAPAHRPGLTRARPPDVEAPASLDADAGVLFARYRRGRPCPRSSAQALDADQVGGTAHAERHPGGDDVAVARVQQVQALDGVGRHLDHLVGVVD